MKGALLLLACSVLTAAGGPREEAQIPSVVANVRVSVETTDGRFVRDLGSDAFEVCVGGVRHPVQVAPPGPGALTLVLLVDMSFSHTLFTARYGETTPVGHSFGWLVDRMEDDLLDLLTPADRLRVARFLARRVDVNDSFLTDRRQQAAAIRNFTDLRTLEPADRFGPSPIWDAVAAVAQLLAREPPPRAILLVTDGKATANRLRMEDAAREAVRHGVTVVVDYEPEWRGSNINTDMNGDRFLRPLAEWTGGVLRVDDSFARSGWSTPPPPFEPLLEALRASYTLSIPLSGNASDLQDLDVRTTLPDLRAHAPRWISGPK